MSRAKRLAESHTKASRRQVPNAPNIKEMRLSKFKALRHQGTKAPWIQGNKATIFQISISRPFVFKATRQQGDKVLRH